MVGIVTALDGEPIPQGQIAGKNVEKHNNPTKIQKKADILIAKRDLSNLSIVFSSCPSEGISFSLK